MYFLPYSESLNPILSIHMYKDSKLQVTMPVVLHMHFKSDTMIFIEKSVGIVPSICSI